jgi:PAS domain S-box-containing protein
MTPTLSSFSTAAFDEDQFREHLEADPRLSFGNCSYWIRKQQAFFTAGEYEFSIESATKAKRYLWTFPSFFESVEHHFYSGLAHAACCSSAPPEKREQHLEALITHWNKFVLWAKYCPENFSGRAYLLGAEIARIEDRQWDAQTSYEEAIRAARANGFIQNEALAYELSSAFYRARKFEKFADAYLIEAQACYMRWGADGKVRQLQENYPFLRESSKPVEAATIAAAPAQLDLLTVIKAQQAISGEIVIDRLAMELLRIALENAGARKGILFVEPDIELLALASLSQADKPVEFKSGRLSPGLDFSASVINYVKRTRETVIINDATADAGDFSNDEYVKRAKPKSLLCMPIVRRAQLLGILCLENDAVAGAFTSDRRTVLELLASQAAISLKIAKLYLDLQRSQSALQQQTASLEVNEERLRLVLENSKTGIWDWDMSGEIQVWSDRCFALLGIPPGTTPDYAHFMQALHPEDRERVDRAVRECLEQGSDYSVEMRCIWPDGSLHWLAARGRSSHDAAGKPLRMSGVILDITERKLIEEEIRTLNAELEQRVIDRTRKLEVANKELESFSYSVSHDLRAPLRSIDGFSRILQEDQAERLDDEGRESLSKIRASTQHMGRLIDDMMKLSRVTLTELRRSPVDLSALARVVAEGLRTAEPQRSVELVIEPGLTAPADEHLMRIVLENLLGNAWKFTGHQPTPRIEFGRTERDGAPAYFVRDNGAGFEQQYAHKLFQAFQRLHSPSEFPGTGIGLATVQRVIHRHGGRVWAEAELERGATFFFTLPDGLDPD